MFTEMENYIGRGTLDPELYEEPFAYKADYGVEITFLQIWPYWIVLIGVKQVL